MCGKQADVFCLASNGFVDITNNEGYTVTDFTHYTNLTWVPDELEKVIRRNARGYKFDYIKQRANCYFINHCSCWAKLSEHQVHNEPEKGFCPVNAEQAKTITLYEITATESYDICATFVVHDEDLISGNATQVML